PFGGVNVIFAGDFGQLPPVGQRALYSRVKCHSVSNPKVQADVFGRLLWLSVDDVVKLVQVMRQSGEENQLFVELLTRLRLGKCTDYDYRSWLDAPIIVSSNEIKDVLNEKAALAFAQRTGQRVHWY
ncbi:hypothetical protein EV363DRAFT_1100578, partial [Boletus edulis]